jgi:hypothetical protein
MLTALERLSQSKIFGWGCFVVALFLLLTAPLVIYNFSESVKGVGWARWPFFDIRFVYACVVDLCLLQSLVGVSKVFFKDGYCSNDGREQVV